MGVGPPDTAGARGAPVGEGLDVYRIPMPFLRLGPWRGDHHHSVGAGREADASGARARLLLTCLLPTPHRRLGLAEAGDKRAWDSLRVDSATARDLRWRDDVRGSGVLCDCDRLTV